ncbi:hypothetical protein [Agathobaculum butyriciproducens]|uniref:hypothetical protein n=1 Tax=Agathobaculum butyriciproducens TaxID=1628085 RepID=UPI0036D282A0
MPHILMIATGGTIACCETAHGLSPLWTAPRCSAHCPNCLRCAQLKRSISCSWTRPT